MLNFDLNRIHMGLYICTLMDMHKNTHTDTHADVKAQFYNRWEIENTKCALCSLVKKKP